MHNALVCIFWLLLTTAGIAQGYVVDTSLVYFEGHPDSLEIKNGVQVANVSGQFLDMAWQRTSQTLPTGWTAAVCDGAACRPPSVDFALYELDTTLNAFQNRMWMYYYPDGVAGTGSTTMKLWDVNGQYDTLVLYYTCTATFTLGVQNNTQSSVLIFPNPAQNELVINRTSSTVGAWEIFDASGKLFLRGDLLSSKEQHLEISALVAGTYYLKLDELTHRFVKE